VRARRVAVALALCAGAAGPIGISPVACAGEGGSAALVVDTGAAVTTYCVALPEESVSGLELIELAGDQHGLDYSFGFGGEAVCRLEGVGPEGDDCFGEYPEFWGYWHGDGSGGWSWAGTGAGGASIEDGDIDGWSWGSGDNGSNHQAPPETEHGDVCAVPEEPKPVGDGPSKGRRSPGEERSPSPDAGGSGPVAAAPEEGAEAAPDRARRPRARRPAARRPERERDRDYERRFPSVAPSPEGTALAAEPTADGAGDGPPLTGLVGLAAAGALGLAAWRGSRRKTRT
jgi:hypothetical protein